MDRDVLAGRIRDLIKEVTERQGVNDKVWNTRYDFNNFPKEEIEKITQEISQCVLSLNFEKENKNCG